ncbi:adhesion G protein-coupled receptor E2-like [Porites lutea]|uniref:adhesion G protein-coupled receptor E2-like n=1 Tax=Porites lutea TaxID=51062 RepID=UPI003CC65E26
MSKELVQCGVDVVGREDKNKKRKKKENTVGSYKCNCPSGYIQKPGANNQCQDIDECSKGYCDLLRSTCVNLQGSYRCDCKSGYENITPKICININECTRGIDSCDKRSSYCTDADGDFLCRCKTGYNQGANNKLCVDVNECLNPIACIEPATCENTVGSYKCNCPSGWVQKPGTNNQCQEAPSP